MFQCVADMLGREVSVAHHPQRIISLVPSQTELLYDLGLRDEVVGITKFCVHPEEWFSTKARVGGTKKVHFDRITALRPDLIIANKEENTKEIVAELAQHYPVWVSDISTMAHATEMIRQIGNLVGKSEEALHMVKTIDEGFETLSSLRSGSVAYFIWRDPWMVAGADTFIHDILQRLGYTNAFAERSRYPQISLIELTSKAPEHVLLSSEPYPFKKQHITELSTYLPNSNIQLVNGELYSWYGSRLLKALSHFQKMLKTP